MLATLNPLGDDDFDLIIVGSGYGGAIPAARLGLAAQLAGEGLRIALLERGREHPIGSFPDEAGDALRTFRHPALNPLGLHEILSFSSLDVIQGCGLGGGSLINANVAITPDADVFTGAWPRALQREAQDGTLWDYFARARAMLGALPYPAADGLKKVAAFRAVAERAAGRPFALDLTVSQEERLTRYGIQRARCNNCGGCMAGCNTGAKNALTTNYLPMAKACGVEIFTCVEVDHLEVAPAGGYRLVCTRRSGPQGLLKGRLSLRARQVVLAAGSLGTTGILLRSRAAGLSLSPRLGQGFSGNGDQVFSFTYNSDRVTDFLSPGLQQQGAPLQAGPAITTAVRLRPGDSDVRRRFLVTDLTFPRPVIGALRKALFALAPFSAGTVDERDEVKRWLRDLEPSEEGALNHTLGYLVMGHDRADGRIELGPDGSARVTWPGAEADPIYSEVNAILAEASAAIGGTFVANPRWSHPLLGGNLFTAHPLGGCATADDADHGVVDDRGRVFDGRGGRHAGLYVSDGSVMPQALGVNPFLTISAFAERVAAHLRAELGLPAYDTTERDDRRTA